MAAMRVSYNGSTLGFQPSSEGSTPSTRSIFFKLTQPHDGPAAESLCLTRRNAPVEPRTATSRGSAGWYAL